MLAEEFGRARLAAGRRRSCRNLTVEEELIDVERQRRVTMPVTVVKGE